MKTTHLIFARPRSVLIAPSLMKTAIRIAVLLASFNSVLWPQSSPAGYVLGPGDNLTINVVDIDEFGRDSKPFRIDLDSTIDLPLLGVIRAADLTLGQIRTAIAAKMKKYIKDPQVTVTISEFHSQPVSILGAVNEPGVHQLEGNKTLFAVLSLAKGLRPDAGDCINITREKTRGAIPLPSGHLDSTEQFYTAEVSARSVMEAKSPQENIQVMPNDVISVPIAQLVYVVGSVQRAGGFSLNERQSISILQALSLAGGLDRTADPKRAKVFRAIAGAAARTERPLNVKDILSGKSVDEPLNANDILLIPTSISKSAGLKVLEAALQTATGVAIYRPW